MTTHFTRRRKLEVLENPDLIQDEELKKQANEMKKKICRSISECSTCIKFYTKHATFKQFINVKNKKKLSKFEEMKKEIETTAWIQCDNLSCRKWRRVPADEIDELAVKDWFCSLNMDTEFNSCLVPEEDTDKYDKMAITVGLNYIKSEYWEGCLVWAKMPGYCSWPAVVTRSLETDDICQRDQEDNPVLYHVEYLGKTHSRGWIKCTALKMFSDGRDEEDTATQVTKKGCKKGKKSCSNKGLKTTFRKGEKVEDALGEAIQLVPLTPTQRLEKCVFKAAYIYDEEPIAPKNTVKHNSKIADNILKETSKNTIVNTKVESKPQFKQKDNVLENDSNDVKLKEALRTKSSEMMIVLSDEEESNNPVSPINFNYNNSLINKTKEERYCLDVEMYTKNERAFEHDVLRFLKRNDVIYRGLPKIQNATITLFQIYLAVHERGGYTEVCKQRQWMSVGREVTNIQMVGGASNRIKSFYERYLYPYELYIKGGDFTTYLKDQTAKKSKKRSTALPPSTEEVDDNTKEMEEATGNAVVPTITDEFELLSECSVDIQEMLDNLEKDGSFSGLEDDVTAAKNKLGIDITFFDESPPLKEDVKTPSDFDEAELPIESAQEVPQFEMLSNPMSDMESQDELLHEMQALQEGMDLIGNVLDQL